MKKKTSLLAFIITAVMVFSLWPQQVNATGGGECCQDYDGRQCNYK